MCCYYPTSIAAIDDDADFLKAISQYMSIPNYIFFTSPETAINRLINENPFNRIQTRLLNSMNSELDNATPEYYTHTVNLRKLHEEIYNSARFQDISVLIVDYHMDNMNGIEVCQQLAKHPAKKILLTGGVDKEKIAIDAFNKGIIHRFINKSDENFPKLLIQNINLLKEIYFNELSSSLIPHLPISSAKLFQNCFYINFLRNFQKQIGSIEHYLLDISGSVVFFDQQGSPTWLIVKNDNELTHYEQIAIDAETSDEIIISLNKRERIPFFFSDTDYQQPTQNWNRYLYEAKMIPGIAGYYYAIVTGHLRNNIDHNRFVYHRSSNN